MPAPPPADRVLWGAGPVTFELRSPNSEVRARARAILGPWVVEGERPGPSGSDPAVRFAIDVEGEGADRRWLVRDGGRVEPTAATSLDAALTAVEYGAIAELLAADSGAAAVHAALVSRGERGLLIAGPKEAGKTTLACALWARGWSLHSDDNALVDGEGLARGTPRRVSLRSASRDLVGEELWERVLRLPGTTRTPAALLFHPRLLELHPTEPEPVRVAAVVFLARRGAAGRGGVLEPIDPARGLVALAPYCNLRDAGMGRALEALQPLADGARFFDLGRGPLPAMIEGAESAIAVAGESANAQRST